MTDETKDEQNQVKESVFMRTIIKPDVYDRLKEFALRYSTGRGNWDFGVAIEILLDFYDQSQIGIISDKIDLILHSINTKHEPKQEEEEKYEEFLGGYKEKV